MDRIGAVLEGIIEGLGIKTRLEREGLVVLWGEVVGEKISHNTRAVGCRGTTLLVEVKNSAWLQELSLMKDDLLKQLNGKAGKHILDGITFYLERQ
jgi:predicted nucleic acid-binding Zn ribbon protein